MFKFVRKTKALLIALPLALLVAHPAFAGSYTVAQGDSLYTIANAFSTSSTKIMQDNNLAGSTIYPGQTLKVPSNTYYVKSGDTLYNISQNYGISLYSLRKANNIWSSFIYPGEKLNIPTALAAGNAVASSSTASGISYTQSDLNLLARLITAEADGQPYTAMVGVGDVVVNRVKNPDYPNTISGVIYQRDSGYYQFTPVENGWIDRPATQEAINAAYDALHGVDPTHGALFYFDDSTTNSWIWSKPIALRSGSMVYTY